MLVIKVPIGEEYFDEAKEEFIDPPLFELELEHSLASVSKWEEEYEKPFLAAGEKTNEEILDYIRMMVLTPNVPPEVFYCFTKENYADINKHLDAKRSATWFSDNTPARQTQTITSELIYSWMFTLGIPIECENWHIQRLFTLIKIYNANNTKKPKQSAASAAAERRKLNAQRKAQLGTRG